MEESFFLYISLFMEQYDKEYFSRDISLLLLNLSEFLIKAIVSDEDDFNFKLKESFFKNLIFNPKIINKFDIYTQVYMIIILKL